MLLYDNDLFLLPKKNDGFIFDPIYSRILCKMPAEDREVQVEFPSGRRLVKINTPVFIWCQTLSKRDLLHGKEQDCFCPECLSKARFISNYRCYSYSKEEPAKILGFGIANISSSGEICWGKNPVVTENLRQINNAFWDTPFNLDMFPGGREHLTRCSKRAHFCLNRKENKVCDIQHQCPKRQEFQKCNERHKCEKAEGVFLGANGCTFCDLYYGDPQRRACACCSSVAGYTNFNHCGCKTCSCCASRCSCRINCSCCNQKCACACACDIEERFTKYIQKYEPPSDRTTFGFETLINVKDSIVGPGCDGVFLTQNPYVLDQLPDTDKIKNKLSYLEPSMVVGSAYPIEDGWEIDFPSKTIRLPRHNINLNVSGGRTMATAPWLYTASKKVINATKKLKKLVKI